MKVGMMEESSPQNCSFLNIVAIGNGWGPTPLPPNTPPHPEEIEDILNNIWFLLFIISYKCFSKSSNYERTLWLEVGI